MKLKVHNKVLQYKGITYQIPQISSLKIVEIKKKNNDKQHISLEPLRYLLFFFVFLSLISFLLLKNGNSYGLLSALLAILFLYFIFRLLKRKRLEDSKDNHITQNALSLRMANGDKPLFISDNRELLVEIKEAILSSMNNEQAGTSISFDNVHIEVTDSENVDIGNVIS